MAILHNDEREALTYHHSEAGALLELDAEGSIELSVIGEGDELHNAFWLRLPEGRRLCGVAGPNGVKFRMKTGHLPYTTVPAI